MLFAGSDLIIPEMPRTHTAGGGGIIEGEKGGGNGKTNGDTNGDNGDNGDNGGKKRPCVGPQECGPLRRGIDGTKPPRKIPTELVPVMKVYGDEQQICAEAGKLVRIPLPGSGARSPKYLVTRSRYFETKDKSCIRHYRLRRKIHKQGEVRFPGTLMSAECKCTCDYMMPTRLRAKFEGGDAHFCIGGILFCRMPSGSTLKEFEKPRFREIFDLEFGRPGPAWYYEGGCYKTGDSYDTGMDGLNGLWVSFSPYFVYARIDSVRFIQDQDIRIGCGKTVDEGYNVTAWGYSKWPEYSHDEEEEGLHFKLFSKPVRIILNGLCGLEYRLTLKADEDTEWIKSDLPFCCLPPEAEFVVTISKDMPEEDCHECKVFRRTFVKCVTSTPKNLKIRGRLIRTTSDMNGCACYGEYYGETPPFIWGNCRAWAKGICGFPENADDCGSELNYADESYFSGIMVEFSLLWLPEKNEARIRADLFFDEKNIIKGCSTDHGGSELFHIKRSPLAYWPPPWSNGWTIWEDPYTEKILPLTFGYQQDGYGVPDYCSYKGTLSVRLLKKE